VSYPSEQRSRRVINEEAELMEALADANKDSIPNDEALEVDSEEEYCK
jgi:hypothetical protein